MESRSEARARVSRRIPATPDVAFSAWLEPQKLSRWILAPGPGERVSHVPIDARVGRSFIVVLSRDDEAIEHRGEYLEIVRPERLAFRGGPSLALGRRGAGRVAIAGLRPVHGHGDACAASAVGRLRFTGGNGLGAHARGDGGALPLTATSREWT